MTRFAASAECRRREPLVRLARLGVCALAGVGALLPASAGDAPAPSAPVRPRRATEPEPRRGAQAAAESAAAAGRAFADAPVSPAVARALQRVAAQAPAAGEVYALITVSDRRTGERRVTTRGEPRPEFAEWVRWPERAPAGQSYAEGDDLVADGEVEIATRWIARGVVSPAAHAISRQAVSPALHATSHEAVSPDLHGASHEAVSPALPPISRDEEERLDQLERNEGSPFGPRMEQGLRERIAAGQVDLESSTLVPVRFALARVPRLALPKVHDVAKGGLLWAGLQLQAARSRAIIERKAALAELQQPLRAAIVQAGGRVVHASWMSGSVLAQVPARALRSLAAHGDIAAVEFVEPEGPAQLDRFTGTDYYIATDAEDFDPSHVGHHGLDAKHSYSSRVVVALGEACIDEENPAWLDGGPDSRTRLTTHDCDPWLCDGCCDDPGGIENCERDDSHGTRVAQLMAGDFMDGQEPALSDLDRRRLTGTCPECKLIFYQDEGLNQRTAVLEEACRHGVDIFESSIGCLDCISCDGNGDYDADVESLISCDAAWIQSAGNNGAAGAICSTSYPADHPWTLAVGGIRTRAPCDTSGAYYTDLCLYDGSASHGAPDGEATIIDLAAPYRFSTLIDPNTSPVAYSRGSGTSFAAPMTAGLAAVMLDWWHQHVSDSLFFDNRLRTFMLLFGDRTTSSVGPSRTLLGFSPYWGAGRVGLVPFDDLDDWSVHRSTYTLDADESVTFEVNIANAARFFKAVVWHDGKDYRNEPEIGLTLDPVNCTRATEAYVSQDNKAMLVIPMEDPLDDCTHVAITIENIKRGSSGTRRFYFAAYSAPEDEVNY